MNKILVLAFCFLTSGSMKAQDTTHIDIGNKTTLTFQPLVGLGILNGGRVGLGVKLNEIIAVEAGYGLGIRASFATIFFFLPIGNDGRTLSEGIIITPFDEKRLSLILYHTYNYRTYISHYIRAWQAMVGWKIHIGESTALRMSAGYAKKIKGIGNDFDDLMFGLDFVLTLDAYKVSW